MRSLGKDPMARFRSACTRPVTFHGVVPTGGGGLLEVSGNSVIQKDFFLLGILEGLYKKLAECRFIFLGYYEHPRSPR